MSKSPKFANRLVNEKSPYLLQHAHNPVDWYPWGEEAFEKARKEDKPIFLSIGYSTCHWCHVMERESFESEDVAKILNEHFVSIKVDREERPDLDKVYMTYVQAATGSGGWPMSVWLTPDLKPFLGGTYFPPEDRYGRAGFKTVLERIAEKWKTDRAAIVNVSENVVEQLKAYATQLDGAAQVALSPSVFDKAASQFANQFDSEWGGFGGAPKFPRPVILNFLHNYYARTGDKRALDMSLFTLRKMALGGIRDHVGALGKGGGGFARYSTDKYWHIPHFEKMLYDNAQLAISYLEAYQLSGDEEFADVARDIFNYVLCDMTDKDGGFYSAEDADSLPTFESERKAEGAFYVWEQKEIDEILGERDGEIFSYLFNIKPGGNAQYDPHGEFVGKNILIQLFSFEEAAARFNLSVDEVKAIVKSAKERLYEARLKRPRPHLDDKILVSWNGLMISAFAKGYQVLGDETYLNAATRATDFILKTLYDEQTHALLRRYRQGEAGIEGKLDDYAFFVQALLDLYESSLEPRYFTTAIRLSETMRRLFEDKENGGFFNSREGDSSVILRMKEDHDGAEPSPNSVATLNLLRLAQMTDREDFRASAEKTLLYFSQLLDRAPSYLPQMLVALSFYLQKPKQIILAGSLATPEMTALRKAIYRKYLPNKILLHASPEAATHLEFLGTLSVEKPTAFVCADYACQLPTSDVAMLEKQLS
ncbi:MAG: thioredoxin domain-containing protein [Chloroherpetonaceae bacterium]|nr:thioredoxin domain-containing protein [Chloroherpetonaceae bacterium]MDW8436838.1 thioredoxin domain-containing protein [Chloroherpetonaceae bacterium]